MEDLGQIKDSFIQEIIHAQNNDTSSLPFLTTELPHKNKRIGQEIFEVLAIGGSNYQQALCQHHENQIRIHRKEEGLIPVFRTKDDFLDFVGKHINEKVTTVALNFAYPLKNVIRDDQLDGELLHGTKEHTFKGMVDEKVGYEIEQYMKTKFKRHIKVHVANDTVCLLLSGLSLGNSKNLACAIVGTGYNAAFFMDETTVVNLEAANFDKFPRSHSGVKIDKESVHPGKGLFEKEISGAYLFHHFRHLAHQRHMRVPEVNTTASLSLLAENDHNTNGLLAREVIARSADLVATHIAGIAEYKQSDTVFVLEGSLFWKGYHYKERVEEVVRKLTRYSVEFVKIEDSGIIGAGMLV